MKKLVNLIGIIALAALIGFSMTACDDGSTTTSGKSAGAEVAAPTLNTKNSSSIAIRAVTAPGNGQTVEYGINTANAAPSSWQDGLTFSGLEPEKDYYIFARSKANNAYNAGTPSTSLKVTTDAEEVIDPTKKDGATVEAPEVDTKTNDSITIKAVTAPDNGQTVEYAINTADAAPSSAWQDGLTFDELEPEAEYFIFARSKANEEYNAGTPSASLKVTTDKLILPPLTGTVSIPSLVAIGGQVTAVTDDLSGAGAISYKWEYSDSDSPDGAWTEITGLEGAAITVPAGRAGVEHGNYLRAVVSRDDCEGALESGAAFIFDHDEVTIEDVEISIAGDVTTVEPDTPYALTATVTHDFTDDAALFQDVIWEIEGLELLSNKPDAAADFITNNMLQFDGTIYMESLKIRATSAADPTVHSDWLELDIDWPFYQLPIGYLSGIGRGYADNPDIIPVDYWVNEASGDRWETGFAPDGILAYSFFNIKNRWGQMTCCFYYNEDHEAFPDFDITDYATLTFDVMVDSDAMKTDVGGQLWVELTESSAWDIQGSAFDIQGSALNLTAGEFVTFSVDLSTITGIDVFSDLARLHATFTNSPEPLGTNAGALYFRNFRFYTGD